MILSTIFLANFVRLLKLKLFYKHIFFILILFSSPSCSSDTSSNVRTGDPFTEEIINSFQEVETEATPLPVSFTVYEPRQVLAAGVCDEPLLVILDYATMEIVLTGRNGDLLFKTGGEGHGPGEFESMMQAHIGADGRLYVIDGLQFRISVFDITEDMLHLTAAFSYKNPSNHFLTAVYVTKFGIYGIYGESEGFMTPENRYVLYSLDEDFTPVKHLLELPGHERQKFETPEFTFYTPYSYLSQTLWSADDKRFYYITTLASSVHQYNLRTGKQDELAFFQFGERSNS
ncbi:MAG: hypothetical protein JJU13_18800, partial [Balneolaceae bacterium]|nr:hypothetical protein [Balneolaceae bacterium]